MRRHLIEFSGRPVAFSLLVAALCVAIGSVCAVPVSQQWRELLPSLDQDFSLGVFIEVPWGVQATLVALVYPIVLSFVALMLQRRAHSTAALRVYILDSAVVPAGASSISLLIVLGLQYFAAPYMSGQALSQLATPLVVMSGTWLFINILLTGIFVFRTIRFLQKEEEELAFTRVALDIVLRAQFTTAIKRNVVHQAPQQAWGFPAPDFMSNSTPQVRTMLSDGGSSEARIHVPRGYVLHDVHLALLGWVSRRWSRRAAKMLVSKTSKGARAPSLVFRANVGSKHFGVQTICEVKDGPRLTWGERILVKGSFVYRASRNSAMYLSIDQMLGELGHEAAQAAEQSRQADGVDRLKDLVSLHHIVLQASADESGARSFSLSMLEAEGWWGNARTFSGQWLEPYRALNQLALRRIEDSDSLFRALALVPTWLSRDMIASPVEPLLEVQQLGSNLVYELGRWWTRKADASLPPGHTTFGGTLPNPANKAYEQAIVQFLGGWGNYRVDDPKTFSRDEEIVWRGLCGRANVYASHLERSANMLLQALSRGDEVGSIWFLDNYLKWLGSGIRGVRDTPRHIRQLGERTTLGLVDLSWPALKGELWQEDHPVTIEVAEAALDQALQRYWESMRLYLIVMLIGEAGAVPGVERRELRMAVALILARGFRRGGTIVASAISSADGALKTLLAELFGARTSVGRLDLFAERLSLQDNDPVVPGWIYSWSHTPAELEALTEQMLTLLVALAPPGEMDAVSSKRLIESWWRDIDKLHSVRRYLERLVAELQGEGFSDRQPAVLALKALIARGPDDAAAPTPMSQHEFEERRASAIGALRALAMVAKGEREMTMRVLGVDAEKVSAYSLKIAEHVFGPAINNIPVEKVAFSVNVEGMESVAEWRISKTHFLSHHDAPPEEEAVTAYAESIRHLVRQSAALNVRTSPGTVVVPYPECDEDEPTVAQRQELLLRYVEACSAARARGENPVILVGTTMELQLEAHSWGDGPWASPLPEGVTVSAPPGDQPGDVVSLVNQVPVVRFEIAPQDGYVVARSLVSCLHVRGTSAANAFVTSWREVEDENLGISLKWFAYLGEA